MRAVKELVRAIGAGRFRGLVTHGGHAYAATNQSERQLAANQETDAISTTADLLRKTDVEVRELSIGSTPTAGLALRGGITEMRPGTYIYGDANQVILGSQRQEDCGLGVIATVISIPAADRAVDEGGPDRRHVCPNGRRERRSARKHDARAAPWRATGGKATART